MKTLTLSAPAKLNLSLEVLGLRPDGYHALDMLMQTVSLCDRITLTQDAAPGWTLSCTDAGGAPVPDIPCDGRNLAWRAAECFFRAAGQRTDSLHIVIEKHIPAQAGMAGGSADAAAVLRGLNAMNGGVFRIDELCKLAEQVGSDVPFCVLGGTARVRGRGELLEPIALSTVQHYAVCKPPFGISTPRLFALSDRCPTALHPDMPGLISALADDRPELAGTLLCNTLEAVALQDHPQLASLRRALLDAGACGARMTGSGSAVFGLFPSEAAARRACALLQNDTFAVFYAHSV